MMISEFIPKVYKVIDSFDGYRDGYLYYYEPTMSWAIHLWNNKDNNIKNYNAYGRFEYGIGNNSIFINHIIKDIECFNLKNIGTKEDQLQLFNSEKWYNIIPVTNTGIPYDSNFCGSYIFQDNYQGQMIFNHYGYISIIAKNKSAELNIMGVCSYRIYTLNNFIPGELINTAINFRWEGRLLNITYLDYQLSAILTKRVLRPTQEA